MKDYIDLDATIERMGNDPELTARVFALFIEDIPHKLKAVQKAAADLDLDVIRRQAHSIKGSSATIGALAMQEAALALEEAAKTSDSQRVVAAASDLLAKAEKTFFHLRQYLDRSSA